MVALITMVSQSLIFLKAQGVSKCTGPRGIYWNYDRNGFAFVVKDSNRDTILYYTSNLEFIEEEANFLEIESNSNSGVFSHPKNTNVIQPKNVQTNVIQQKNVQKNLIQQENVRKNVIQQENVRIVSRGETKIVVISGDETRGATYHDSSKETFLVYKSILVSLTTGKIASYSEEEVANGRVPSKIQFNVSSAPNDAFLVLWGDPLYGQFYSSQPLERIDRNGARFVIDTEKYRYFLINILSGCARETCLDSTIDGAAFNNGQLFLLVDHPHPTRDDCDYSSAAFGYKGNIWFLYLDQSCNDDNLIKLMNLLPIGFESRDIVAAMTINDTLYLITKQEVAMVRIRLGSKGSIVPVNFIGKKLKSQVWPGIPDNVDAAYYNDTNGLTYFVDREYQMVFKKSKRVHGGLLIPNIGSLFQCSNYDYEKFTGKLFGAKSMEEYIRVLVKKRQGCGDSCPDSIITSSLDKETDNTVLIITLAVVATILIVSIIILVVIVSTNTRRRKRMDEMSTVGNSLWNSDMTDIRTVKSRGQNDVTIKGVPKKKR